MDVLIYLVELMHVFRERGREDGTATYLVAPDDETVADVDMSGIAALESLHPDDVASDAWIKQQLLPYPLDAQPYIGKEKVEQHWGVSLAHACREAQWHDWWQWVGGDVDCADDALIQCGMLSSFNAGREPPHALFFHAAQIWNHNIFWRSMKPSGGGKPPEWFLKFINRVFGSYDGMIQQFMDAALTQFGSGWVWLSYKSSKLPHVNSRSPIPSDKYGRLVISKSPNTINPLVWGHSPLLAIDVWENRRAKYVSTFLEKLLSWEMVESRLRKAVVRAIERDSNTSTKQLRKQLRRRPRSQDQQDPGNMTLVPAGEEELN